MFCKPNQQVSNSVSAESSQKDQPTNLWKTLAETEQEITKGGFGFPGFPGGPWRPGDGRKRG